MSNLSMDLVRQQKYCFISFFKLITLFVFNHISAIISQTYCFKYFQLTVLNSPFVSKIKVFLYQFKLSNCRRLHCPRNTVHVNLFISFILRSLVTIIRDNVLVQGLGLPGDVEQTPYDTVIFITNGTVSFPVNIARQTYM